MRGWFRLPCFFNIILLSWHAFGSGLWKASCACWWWLSRRGACVDLCGEHRWIAATEAGWSQGFMARPVGHFQCWTYICWGHFPHNCQASSTSISICVCVCVCVWVTLIRLWLHLLSFYLQFSCLWRFFWNFIDMWCCLLLLWQARTAGRAWNHITIWGFWTALCLSSTMVRHNPMCLICQQVVIIRLSIWTYFQEYC